MFTDNELEMMYKETVIDHFKYYCSSCLERLKHDNQSL